MNPPFKLITREQAATLLSSSLGTLDKHVREGVLPAPRRLGSSRQLYWRSDDFYAALHHQLSPSAGVAVTPVMTADQEAGSSRTAAPDAAPAADTGSPSRRPRREANGTAATTAVLRARGRQMDLEEDLND